MQHLHATAVTRRFVTLLSTTTLVISVVCAVAAVAFVVHDIATGHSTYEPPAPSITPTTAGPADSTSTTGPTLTLGDDRSPQVLGVQIDRPASGPSAPAGSDTASGAALPNLVLTPTGALFSVPAMMPNDAATADVTLRLSGDTGSVSLSTANVTSAPCSNCAEGVGTATDLAGHLRLTVTDDTTGATVYGPDAPLIEFAPRTVCGAASGACPTWATDESHHFTFTVRFPNGLSDNAFQGTATSLDFVWTRS